MAIPTIADYLKFANLQMAAATKGVSIDFVLT